MFRSGLCSLLLPLFAVGTVTVFDHAPLWVAPSQKPTSGFPAQASSWDPSPDRIGLSQEGVHKELQGVGMPIRPCQHKRSPVVGATAPST